MKKKKTQKQVHYIICGQSRPLHELQTNANNRYACLMALYAFGVTEKPMYRHKDYCGGLFG